MRRLAVVRVCAALVGALGVMIAVAGAAWAASPSPTPNSRFTLVPIFRPPLFLLCASGGAITYGDTARCVLGTGQSASYLFHGTQGDRLAVQAVTEGSSLPPAVTISHSNNTSACTDIASCVLLSTDTYRITVSYQGGSGTFDLGLQNLNFATNPYCRPTKPDGSMVTGTLNDAQIGCYSFFANAGDTVIAQVSSTATTFEPQARIYSLAGSQVNCDPSACTLPAGGQFGLTIRDRTGLGSGGYTLTLALRQQVLPSSSPSQPEGTTTSSAPSGGGGGGDSGVKIAEIGGGATVLAALLALVGVIVSRRRSGDA